MTEHEELLMLRELAAKQKQQLEEYEIKSASNESVVSITKKLLLCTTPSFEALTVGVGIRCLRPLWQSRSSLGEIKNY